MIINGTTNVILTSMERDAASLESALADAQRRGFAEADPSADVDGHDAAAKLVLLSRLAFDAPLATDDVVVAGIRGVRAEDIRAALLLGGSVKLVAYAQRVAEAVTLSVGPTVVRAGHPLHGVDDSENAVVVTSDLAGRVTLRGLGAGGDSTASAVVSDIVATAAEPRAPTPVPRTCGRRRRGRRRRARRLRARAAACPGRRSPARAAGSRGPRAHGAGVNRAAARGRRGARATWRW